MVFSLLGFLVHVKIKVLEMALLLLSVNMKQNSGFWVCFLG